ncbi:MAG: hypothetical protein ABI972_12285 [Acidobacteriota bacterium]
MHILRGAAALLCISAAWAGPREFALRSYDDAVRARGLQPERVRIRAVVDSGAPESFRILGQTVLGGDLRGLMYGIFEAARQVRDDGRLKEGKYAPALAIRGVRVRREDLPSGDDLRAFFALLAEMRFNTVFVTPEPPPELRPTAYAYGLKLAGASALNHVLDVKLPIEGTSIPWADPVSAARILSEADVLCLHGFAVAARLPIAGNELYYAAWGLAGYDPEVSGKRFVAMLRPRFGKSADDAWKAVSLASRALTFIPEARFLSTPAEATHMPATARLTPLQLATAYHLLVRDAEDALLPFKSDLGVLQPMIDYGRMKARELLAQESAAWYSATGQDSAYYLARREYKAAAARVDAVKAAGLPVPTIPEVQEMESSVTGEIDWRPLPDPLKLTHIPPKLAVAGKPVVLSLVLAAPKSAERVRLHWHDGESFHTEEAPASRATFTLTPPGDVRYYFEVVSDSGSGWFYPDPLAGPAYLRLNVRNEAHR